MPIHDFKCVDCGAERLDVVFTTARSDAANYYHEDARMNKIRCTALTGCGGRCACHGPMRPMIERAGFTHDLRPEDHTRVIDLGDGAGERRVSSIHEMRQIEREHDRKVRNGEAPPLRFRALHQNKGNLSVNTLGSNAVTPAPRSRKVQGGRGRPEE